MRKVDAVENSGIGERLRRLRRYTKLSARALDQLVGVSRGTTANLEGVKRDGMRIDSARKYVAALGCSLEWLLMGVGKPPTAGQVSNSVAVAKSRAA